MSLSYTDQHRKALMHGNRIIVLVMQWYLLCVSNSPTRGFLSPASGFQSTQFRLLEIMLGLKEELRVQYAECPFTYVCMCLYTAVHMQIIGRHEVAYTDCWLYVEECGRAL